MKSETTKDAVFIGNINEFDGKRVSRASLKNWLLNR